VLILVPVLVCKNATLVVRKFKVEGFNGQW